MTDVIAALGILVGSLLALIAAIGMFRLPEVFARMHAATKPAVLGLTILVVSTAFVLGDASATTRLVLVAAIQLFTAPVAMYAVGRAVGRATFEDAEETVQIPVVSAEGRES